MQYRNLAKDQKRVPNYSEPWGTVYLNGEYIPAEQAKLSIADLGFLMGDAVYDVARTVNHKPYRLKDHIERLYKSLKYLRMDPGVTQEEMEQITLRVLEKSVHLLGENDEYWLTQRVSRGPHPASFHNLSYRSSCTLLVYCSPVPFRNHASAYKRGQKMITVSVRRIPPECVDPRIKTQSRLNFILAILEAKQKDPEALPLMLTLDGNITETWGANFLFVSNGKVMSPVANTILEGITRKTIFELANDLGLQTIEGNFTPYDVYNADEAFLTATGSFILPVCSLDGIKIGEHIPGQITRRLIKAFSEQVGVDIVEQALSHLSEEEKSKLNG